MRTIALALALALAGPLAMSAQSPQDIAQGAQVWAQNCTRCHNARASQERTDGQWLTIVLHMRARANLTRSDAGLVTAFMQATNLPVPGPSGIVADQRDAAGASDPGEASGPNLDEVIRYLRQLATEDDPGQP